MAYFAHAFQKMLVGTEGFPSLAGQSTLELSAGQIAVVSSKTHQIQNLTGSPTYAATPLIYLAQGSFHASDKIGPFHGGYQETVKSKGINPKYVSKFYLTVPSEAQRQIIKIVTPLGNVLPTNKTFRLRLDVKGSAALRFATRNLYKTLDGFTGCPGDPDEPVAALTVLEQWALQINEDPFLKSFLTAAVATTGAGHELTIEAAYVDTVFGDASFDPKDHFEKEPIEIYASALTDEGNPCDVSLFEVSEVQEGKQGSGYGETLVRELILDKRYRQEPWQQDPRMREILQETTLTDLSRSQKYHVYHILHSVPRNTNPSGVFNADQYLIKIVVSERNTTFEDYMNAYLESAGSAVQLEVLP
jgi:hypothetical protein